MSSMLQTIATIASDVATMIQIVSMDMDRDGDEDEIAPMPTEATTAPAEGDHGRTSGAVDKDGGTIAVCQSESSETEASTADQSA